MCFVHVRAMAVGVVSGGVLLATGLAGAILPEGVANAAPITGSATPQTSKACGDLDLAIATSSPPASSTPTPTSSQTAAHPTTSPSHPTNSTSPSPTPSSGAPSTTPATTNSASPSSTASATSAALTDHLSGPTPSASSTTPTATLCVSVTQPAGSIKRGSSGTFTIQVSSTDWTPPGSVIVGLTAQPSGMKPQFTTQSIKACKTPAKLPAGTTTATECTLPADATLVLQAQLPVPADATSTSKVTLEAVVLPATTGATLAKSPLTETQTAQVTAAASAPAWTPPASHGATKSPQQSTGQSTLGPVGTGSFSAGDLPELNADGSSVDGTGSSVLNPGNAASLFPKISPAASPSTAPGVGLAGSNGKGGAKADPAAKVAVLPLGMPVVTAQVIGLLALGLAFLLAMTRLSLRRPGKGQHR